jgi:hypothetical protein
VCATKLTACALIFKYGGNWRLHNTSRRNAFARRLCDAVRHESILRLITSPSAPLPNTGRMNSRVITLNASIQWMRECDRNGRGGEVSDRCWTSRFWLILEDGHAPTLHIGCATRWCRADRRVYLVLSGLTSRRTW